MSNIFSTHISCVTTPVIANINNREQPIIDLLGVGNILGACICVVLGMHSSWR